MNTSFALVLEVSVAVFCILVGAYCLRTGLDHGLWSRPAWRATSRLWLVTVAFWCGVMIWALFLR